jgi:hypothetical protein
LQLASDGQEHRIGDVIAPLGKKFGLTPDEFEEDAAERSAANFLQQSTLGEDLPRTSQAVGDHVAPIFGSRIGAEMSCRKTQKKLMFGC